MIYLFMFKGSFFSKNFKIKSLVFVAVLSFLAMPKLVSAQTSVCNPPQTIFEKLGNTLQSFDIRRTGNNIATTFVVDFLPSATSGITFDQMMGCGSFMKAQGAEIPDAVASCDGTDAAVCQSFLNTWASSGDPLRQFASGQSAGSLLGLVYTTESAAKEPLPVNLAYYGNHYASRLPFADTALAQQVNYNQPFLAAVFGVWTFFRNISYGIVSIILIFVGFMIMTRRRISQQAVVTVQYALPKIVIALILITFSYPIAAIIMTLARVIALNMVPIMASLGSAAPVTIGFVLLVILAALVAGATGVGVSLLLIIGVVAVAIIVLALLVQIRMLIIYLKMLISLVTAPLEFAIGAIPGTDDKIAGWFKRMVVYALSFISMSAAYNLVLIVGSRIIVDQFHAGGASVISGGLIALLGSPFIFIFGFFFALQIPGKIEAAIMGDKKRK